MLLNEYLNLFRKVIQKIVNYGFADSIYIREEIPEDSVIIVPDYEDDCLYRLIFGYEYYLWDFESENISDLEDFVNRKEGDYLILDLYLMNSTEYEYISSDSSFEEIFERGDYVLLKYK